MSRATVILNSQHERSRVASWAAQAKSGTIVEFRESKRTTDQNSLLWACLTEIARKVEWHGMKLPADDWKDIFTAALRKHRFVPGLDANTVVPLGMRTSDMTKQEFSDLLELINAFAAERGIEFGHTIHEPGSEAPSPLASEPVTSVSDQDIPPLSDDVSSPAVEPVEAGAEGQEQSEPAPASEISPVLRNLMEECRDKFIQTATRTDLTTEARREHVRKVREAFSDEMPERLDFIAKCVEATGRIVAKPSSAETERVYLGSFIK